VTPSVFDGVSGLCDELTWRYGAAASSVPDEHTQFRRTLVELCRQRLRNLSKEPSHLVEADRMMKRRTNHRSNVRMTDWEETNGLNLSLPPR